MFERFTDRARRVVVLAQEEARLLNHNRIGTEHLLLGLLRENQGVAAKALTSLRIDLGAVRERVDEKAGRSSAEQRTGHIPFTSRAKLVLELSLREALQLGHNYIGTEHILLGMTREGEGVAAQVLVDLGADLNRVREQVIGLLRDFSVERSAGPASPTPVRRPSSGVPGRSERALLSGLRAQLKEIEARLAVVEQRVGFGPDVSELDEAIVRTLGEKHAAADAQDYEQAAVLRNTERMLRAEKESKQRQWSATHPDLSSLAETVRQLDDEVRLLRALLSQHGIEPTIEPESGAGETTPSADDERPPDDQPARDQPGARNADDEQGGAA